MSSEARRAFQDAAGQPSGPVDPQAIVERGKTLRVRRMVAFGFIATILVGGTSALAIAGFTDRSTRPLPAVEPTDSPEPTGAFTTYRSDEFGYTVTYPSDWYRAEESLTPSLSDPLEIFAVGTFPLSYEEGLCAQLPSSAIDQLGRHDAFISIQERAGYEDPPPRPGSFAGSPTQEHFECVLHDRADVYWEWFRDGGRSFYALVLLGRDLSDDGRAEAWQVVDSITFDEAAGRDFSGESAFQPYSRSEIAETNGRKVIPVVFPDGLRAEIEYPEELGLETFRIGPYWSAALPGQENRDLRFVFGSKDVLVRGMRHLRSFEGAYGRTVELWDNESNPDPPILVFSFGDWYVGVDDRPELTEEELAEWSRSLWGTISPEGFIVLEAYAPLKLEEQAGPAGPSLGFFGSGSNTNLFIYPVGCGEAALPDDAVTELHRGDQGADWCLGGSFHVVANSTSFPEFVQTAIEHLRIKETGP